MLVENGAKEYMVNHGSSSDCIDSHSQWDNDRSLVQRAWGVSTVPVSERSFALCR